MLIFQDVLDTLKVLTDALVPHNEWSEPVEMQSEHLSVKVSSSLARIEAIF